MPLSSSWKMCISLDKIPFVSPLKMWKFRLSHLHLLWVSPPVVAAIHALDAISLWLLFNVIVAIRSARRCQVSRRTQTNQAYLGDVYQTTLKMRSSESDVISITSIIIPKSASWIDAQCLEHRTNWIKVPLWWADLHVEVERNVLQIFFIPIIYTS